MSSGFRRLIAGLVMALLLASGAQAQNAPGIKADFLRAVRSKLDQMNGGISRIGSRGLSHWHFSIGDTDRIVRFADDYLFGVAVDPQFLSNYPATEGKGSLDGITFSRDEDRDYARRYAGWIVLRFPPAAKIDDATHELIHSYQFQIGGTADAHPEDIVDTVWMKFATIVGNLRRTDDTIEDVERALRQRRPDAQRLLNAIRIARHKSDFDFLLNEYEAAAQLLRDVRAQADWEGYGRAFDGRMQGIASSLHVEVNADREALRRETDALSGLVGQVSRGKAEIAARMQTHAGNAERLARQCSQTQRLLDRLRQMAREANQSAQLVFDSLDPESVNLSRALTELSGLKRLVLEMQNAATQNTTDIGRAINDHESAARDLSGLIGGHETLLVETDRAAGTLEARRQRFLTLQGDTLATMDQMRNHLRVNVASADMTFYDRLYNEVQQAGDPARPAVQAARAAVAGGRGDVANWRRELKDLPAECRHLVNLDVGTEIENLLRDVRSLADRAQRAYDNPPRCTTGGGRLDPGTVYRETVVVTAGFPCVSHINPPPAPTQSSCRVFPARFGAATPNGACGWSYKSQRSYQGQDEFRIVMTSRAPVHGGHPKVVTTTFIFAVTVVPPYSP